MTPPACPECDDNGWVRATDGGPDACGMCMRLAEVAWVSRRPPIVNSTAVIKKESWMKSIEQAGPDGAGTVTAACVIIAGTPTFELMVHAALLRLLPWFRGGRDVSVLLTGSEMRVMRDGPYRLRAVMAHRLEKLPPVQMRVPRLEYLHPDPRSAEPVAHEVTGLGLSITLPAWARPPVPHSAPIVSFSDAVAGGRR